jgi:ABC-2 type transport system permease protein
MTASGLSAVMVREGKIRATNATFIFWDVVYPLGYLLVFARGMRASMGFTSGLPGVDYGGFFLAGVLGMASFGIASNTAWSFFLDRDNGIFDEMLTYPLGRAEYLVGKVLFNVAVALVQAVITIALAALLVGVPLRPGGWAEAAAVMVAGTCAWFFFYAIFALRIRRNDAFNAVTSVFYFVFLFASSIFYPLGPLPAAFRLAALANPITWQVDLLRHATIGVGEAALLWREAGAFGVFLLAAFAGAVRALEHERR